MVKSYIEVVVVYLALIGVATIIILSIVNHDTPAQVSQRPYLCLTPYHPDYCKANQFKMYQEQAVRER